MVDPDELVHRDLLWRRGLTAVADRAGVSEAVLVGGLASLAIAVVVAFALVGWQRAPSRPVELDLPRASAAAGDADSSPTSAGRLIVHCAGAVTRPGVYRLAAGSRVADLVEAAGGAAPGADIDQLNLAALLQDGERIYVPRTGEAAAGGIGSSGGVVQGRLDLNTATVEQLDALPGIGPATAQAIVSWRKSHGRFRSVQQLLDVRGIGEAKLAQLRDLVRV